MKEFLGLIGILNKMEFDIEEVGMPLPLHGMIVSLKLYHMDME